MKLVCRLAVVGGSLRVTGGHKVNNQVRYERRLMKTEEEKDGSGKTLTPIIITSITVDQGKCLH